MLKHTFFEAIFFDMDGTLIDSEPTWLESEIELMARYNFAWTVENQAHCLGGPLARVGEYMNDLASRPESATFFVNALVDLMVSKMSTRATLMAGASQILAFTREIGTDIAMVSASPRVLVDVVLQAIYPVTFELTISSDDVQFPKPDPESYIKAAEHFGVNPERCLILEDSKTGVNAAVASGARVIAIPHLVPIEENEQVKVFSSLTEINERVLRKLYSDWFD